MNQYVSQGIFDRRVKLIEEKLKHINNDDLLSRLQAEHDYFIEQLRNTELNLEELIEQIEQSGGNTNQKLNDLINSYNNFKANTLRINDVFDADGQFDGSRIRPLSVETAALTVGQRSQQLALNGIEFKLDPYETSGGGVLKWRSTSNSSSPNTNNIAGLMFHYGYGTNTDPKIYLIYEGSHSFTSNDTSKGFYIYAVISKASSYIYTEPSTVSEEYFNGYFELLYDSNHTKIYNNILPSFDSTKEYCIEVNDKKEEIIINEENFRKNLVGLYYKNGDTYSLVLTNKPTYSSTTKYCTKKSNDIPAENGSSTTYNGETISYNNTAAILVTSDKIPSEGDNTHTDGLYIQLGYVSVELSAGNTNNPFYRKVDMTYGQTTINGRLITTGRIEGNGAYFDLDTGDIGGTIKFKDNNSYISYNDYIDSKISDYNTTLNNTVIKDLKKQVDGAIDTWFYDYMPVHSTSGAPDSTTPLNVVPYKTWNDIDTTAGNNNEKIKHLGDIFYDNTSGYAFRFSNTGTEQSPTFVWETITDSAVIKALADAATAQATADGKLTIFASQPTVDYKIGDLWNNAVYSTETTYLYNGETYNTPYNNVLLVCIRNRVNNTFSITDWIPSDRSIKTADLSLARVEAAKAELLAIKDGTTTIAGGMITNNLLELKNIVGATERITDYVSTNIYYKRGSNSGGYATFTVYDTEGSDVYPSFKLWERTTQVTDVQDSSGYYYKEVAKYFGGGTPGEVTAGLSGISNFPCYWSGGTEAQAANYVVFKNRYHYYDEGTGHTYPTYLNTRTTWFGSLDDFIFNCTIDNDDHQPHFDGTRKSFQDAIKTYDTLKRNYGSVVDSDSDVPRLPVVIIDFNGFCKFGDFYIYNSQAYYDNQSGFGHYKINLNGSDITPQGTLLGSFYAPTSAGTNGYILKSNGSGAPTWLQTLPVANGGTGQTSQANINKAFIGALGNGTSDVTDGTEFVSSYASDNGFSDSNAVNVAYRRSFLKVWNYIKGKMSSDSAVNISGNAATATKLALSVTLWGQSFDGSSNVSGDITNAGNITSSSTNSKTLGSSSNIWSSVYAKKYYADGTGSGYFANGKPAVYHNGTNLWIGAEATDTNVFTGGLYLNAGNTTDGYRRQQAYLCVGSTVTSTTGSNRVIVNGSGGSETQPIYINSLGRPTSTTYSLSSTVNAGTANRLAYYTNSGIDDASTTYVSNTKLAINSTSEPSYNFYVNGDSGLNGTLKFTTNGALIKNTSNYTILHSNITDKYTLLNYDGAANQYTTYIDGYDIRLRYGTSHSEVMRINASGNVGIGTSSPAYKLDVSGVIGATDVIFGYAYSKSNNMAAFVFDKPGSNYTGIGAIGVSDTIHFGPCSVAGAWVSNYNQKWEFQGDVYALGGVTALASISSDKRLKKEIKPFNAKQIIDKLSPVEFEWNKKANKYNSNLELNKKNYGLIAQDSDGIIDNLVFDLPDGKGYKGVRYEKLIPILLQAIKEQQKEINELKKQLK